MLRQKDEKSVIAADLMRLDASDQNTAASEMEKIDTMPKDDKAAAASANSGNSMMDALVRVPDPHKEEGETDGDEVVADARETDISETTTAVAAADKESADDSNTGSSSKADADDGDGKNDGDADEEQLTAKSHRVLVDHYAQQQQQQPQGPLRHRGLSWR